MHRFRLLVVLLFAAVLGGCQVTLDDSHVDGGLDDGSAPGETRSVSLYWNPPLERVNGEPLPESDISGYEIRYRAEGESQYQRVVIESASTTQYHLDDLSTAEYRFELATIDSNGLYSDFVVATH